jgi:uncharacterized membrane protein
MSKGHSHTHHAPDIKVPVVSRVILLGVLAIISVAIATGMIALWPDSAAVEAASDKVDFAAPGVTFPRAEVTEVEKLCGGNPRPIEAPACWTLHADVTSGASEGEAIEVEIQGPTVGSGIQAGDSIQVMRIPTEPNGDLLYSFYGVDRTAPLGLLTIAFVGVVLVVARWRGLLALVGLLFAGGILIKFLLPALLIGEESVTVTVVGAAAIMYVVLYLAHGPSIRTSTALAGTLAGVAITGGLAAYAVGTSRLSGITDDQSALLSSIFTELDYQVLLTSAIIIAGLGVLNDVTITQSSAVWELRSAGPTLNRRELFRSGMRIGRDHIASTIYTIVFAYAGAALSVLLVLFLYNRPVLDLLSTEDIATEVARTLCSAIGLVLAVPITTAIAAITVAKAAPERASGDPEPRHSVEQEFPPRPL